MGELDVVDMSFARAFAPLAGFRNILVHEYLDIDWDDVFHHLHRTPELHAFAGAVRRWLAQRSSK